MGIMKRLLMAVGILALLTAPSLAAIEYISATATGAATAEVDVRSSIKPSFISGSSQIVLTHIAASSDLVGADLTVKGYIPGCAATTLSSATAAAQAVISVSATAEFTAGDFIFIEDKADNDDYESGIIASVGAGILTLQQNLAHGYPANSVVYQIKNVADLEPFVTSVSAESVYKEPINLVSVPVGSPISVRLAGTSACKLSISGFRQ
ncbi:MAG: hypothetical protein KAV87_02205 [Desulfobacteraceae bacterium]|nr:hypothetical protein [Desulfobacteraceae bacterium]